jgi:hypothetical protein
MKKQMIRLAAGVAFCMLAFFDARAGQQVSTAFQMPVRLQAAIEASGCTNAPGPQITINGALTLGGFGVDLIFRNNEKGTHTHTEEATANVVVVPAGESLSIPKQPVLGGVGGNPFIWIQIMGSNGQPMTGEIFLGRCVQGLFQMTSDFALPSTAAAEFATANCENNPGPYITMDGALGLSGLNARLVFRNNDNPVGGPHETDEAATVDVVILPAGQSIQFPKQPVLGGVGGNPWISVLFRQGNGDPIGSEFLLGRCVQLSQ